MTRAELVEAMARAIDQAFPESKNRGRAALAAIEDAGCVVVDAAVVNRLLRPDRAGPARVVLAADLDALAASPMTAKEAGQGDSLTEQLGAVREAVKDAGGLGWKSLDQFQKEMRDE